MDDSRYMVINYNSSHEDLGQQEKEKARNRVPKRSVLVRPIIVCPMILRASRVYVHVPSEFIWTEHSYSDHLYIYIHK